MIKNFGTILAVVLLTVSCSRGVSRIQTRLLSRPNPTSFLFPLPLDDVHTRALDAFSIDHQFDEPPFGRLPQQPVSPNTVHLESFFDVECFTNAVFSKAVFGDTANTNDIYLHTFHSPFALSDVYRGRDGGLPLIAAFHLHLIASGSDTLVTVIALDSEVINGRKFGLGHGGPGYGWKCEKVQPTTVEEYVILRYLGRYLGITNMPNLVLPRP